MQRRMSYYFPIIHDIVTIYQARRRQGMGRDEAIAQLREEYLPELEDPDDGPPVRVALALALCKKSELTGPVLADAETAAAELLSLAGSEKWDNKLKRTLENLQVYLQDPAHLGEEFPYPIRKPYIPNWKIGDTFSHKLTCTSAKYVGIEGWYVLLRKVGEYEDMEGKYYQVCYVTLCPPEQLPKTEEDLYRLGCLRLMAMLGSDGSRWSYLALIRLKSKKHEEGFELTPIGCFPNVKGPSKLDRSALYVARGIAGKEKIDGEIPPYPDYENTVCRCYWEYGIEKPDEETK